MRKIIKDFIKIVVETLPIKQPICEFGSLQVSGQEEFANLRPYFTDQFYIGCDMQKGRGVDLVLDLHNASLGDESVGTVLVMDTLEHVEYVREAMLEIYRILKPDGIVIMSSVMKFPIHEYPHDYWRFSPEGFASLLKIFPAYHVNFAGDENFPHTVIGVGFKSLISANEEKFFKNNINKWRSQWISGHKIQGRYKKILIHCIPPIIYSLYKKLLRRFYRRK